MKARMIDTRFWNDNFVVGLNPLDRYLFLYFLTNEHTNIAGIYEIPLRTIAFESGLDKEMIPKMLKRLKGKVEYIDGWIAIKNFVKHQNTKSLTVQKGIQIELAKIPKKIMTKLENIGYAYGIDRVSGGIIYLNLNSNLNPNTNSNLKEGSASNEALRKHTEGLTSIGDIIKKK